MRQSPTENADEVLHERINKTVVRRLHSALVCTPSMLVGGLRLSLFGRAATLRH